ncbi:hypothetical protein WN55_02721 [Dufourea novaeangliae]|uniref:Uncharacterized protein n=1 Tax=Dufourea novaeangliae TaxID=178035 RepID=A0A154NXH4_DUFNO|nr:hypothetical protein WN55_02721 [Dufourea novaeangliae]
METTFSSHRSRPVLAGVSRPAKREVPGKRGEGLWEGDEKTYGQAETENTGRKRETDKIEVEGNEERDGRRKSVATEVEGYLLRSYVLALASTCWRVVSRCNPWAGVRDEKTQGIDGGFYWVCCHGGVYRTTLGH